MTSDERNEMSYRAITTGSGARGTWSVILFDSSQRKVKTVARHFINRYAAEAWIAQQQSAA